MPLLCGMTNMWALSPRNNNSQIAVSLRTVFCWRSQYYNVCRLCAGDHWAEAFSWPLICQTPPPLAAEGCPAAPARLGWPAGHGAQLPARRRPERRRLFKATSGSVSNVPLAGALRLALLSDDERQAVQKPLTFRIGCVAVELYSGDVQVSMHRD